MPDSANNENIVLMMASLTQPTAAFKQASSGDLSNSSSLYGLPVQKTINSYRFFMAKNNVFFLF